MIFLSPRSLCLLRRTFTPPYSHRTLTVLAIETSCDDTSVALLDSPTRTTATLLAHQTITSPNRIYGGIHPLVSVASHKTHLATLLSTILPAHKPTLIAVTRGPGMLSSLSVGLDTAKGLSLAWGIPLVGVHHMQAHALTPRLLSALHGEALPEFPFMTVLVSGGHTLVVKSNGLTRHGVLCGTVDLALGDVVDKCARKILPENVVEDEGDVVAYGAVLERFCFQGGEEYDYFVDGSVERRQQDRREWERWGDWRLSVPLGKSKASRSSMCFSFSGLGSSVERYFEVKEGNGGVVSVQERRELGRKVMMLAFEHVASRVVIGLDSLEDERFEIKNLVVSGGVAANKFLGHLLKRYLEEKGYPHIQLVVPPQKYCTDNAAMIAWAGLEMYRAGWQTGLRALPIKKWSLDNDVYVEGEGYSNEHGTGGVLGVSDWICKENTSE